MTVPLPPPGSRLFFPNLVLKLVRSAALPPNQVAFRVPLPMNKLDIRNYLSSLYGLDILDVRTMITPGKMTRDKITNRMKQATMVKKAIVTLSTEFQWPEPPSEADGAVPVMPSMATWGKSSSKKYRDRIPPPRDQADLPSQSPKGTSS